MTDEPMSRATLVRCVTCGFLAVRDADSDNVGEATESIRETGRTKSAPSQFLCYKRSPAFPVATLTEAMRTIARFPVMGGDNDSLVRLMLHSLDSPIDCQQHCEWRPGKSPLEHEEMSFVQLLESRTLQWREEDLRRQSEAEARADKWQKQVEALAEVRHQENREQAAKTIVVAWIGLGVAILARLRPPSRANLAAAVKTPILRA